MQKIKYAAIKYQLKSDPGTDRYVHGYSHAQCVAAFRRMCVLASDRISECEEQGFMTDAGDFVDRESAYIIAEKAGQLTCSREDKVLYSESVKYC